MKYLSHPDIQLYLVSLLLLAFSLVVYFNYTYAVFDLSNLLIYSTCISVFIALEAWVYSITARFERKKTLQYLHVASIFISALFIAAFNYLFLFAAEMPLTAVLWENIANAVAVIFCAGQVAFVANIVAGASRRKTEILQK